MNIIIGEIIIAAGFIFMLIGAVAQLKNKSFFKKILVSSIIDSAAVILVFSGIITRQGLTGFSLKVFVILVIMLVISPLATHKLARSAHLSHLGEKDDN